MKLPEKFQMRVSHLKGFTHQVSLNSLGDYEVSWARGYPNHIRAVPRKVFDRADVIGLVSEGFWIVVEVPEQKKQEEALPDEFDVVHTYSGNGYTLKKSAEDDWRIYRKDRPANLNHRYTEQYIKANLDSGVWELIVKKPLTDEQQKANKRIREEVAALDSSIKLNEQDIHHKQLLIRSYEERKAILLTKIVEE